jgi:alanine-glyoxylate transaminase/serine-glyoxylate transaminase/serine-pyruvate transaminase
VSPGDKVIVAQNGVFGGRMKENVERCGATPVMVVDDWGKPVDPHKVEAALKAHPDAKAFAFVHAETSTGARSDAATLAKLARDRGLLTIMDTVTGLGGIDVDIDGWGIDAAYSGTQKCLSCVPGLSPVTFSPRAQEVIQRRTHKVQSWFLDLSLVMAYWGGGGQRAYHHTAPINALYGLHEALVILEEEGLENAWARHRTHHAALAAGLAALGIDFVVDAPYRLPQLNCVTIPAGVDDAALRRKLLDEYNLEIGAGLGPLAGKVWRIGLMGHAANRTNVLFCLGALEALLGRTGAVAAARASYG